MLESRALLAILVAAVACSDPELRPEAKVLAVASPEVLERMRATPHDYFRFINHEWTARVCDVFASDIGHLPTVQLHGDAHVEQYAVTSERWGLDDFDDSARGPALIDIVRFLGSVDLAARQRGWSHERARLGDRFLVGYRKGLSATSSEGPSQPQIVRRLLAEKPPQSREAFLESADDLMSRVDDAPIPGVTAGMKEFAKIIAGNHQLGRLNHRILAAGPEVAGPEMTIQGEHLRNWWIHSWEPSYHEIAIDELRTVDESFDIVYDSGLQLGTGSILRFDRTVDNDLRRASLESLDALEPRLRQAANTLVEELLRTHPEARIV